MRQVFADNFYWVALLNPRDAWHQRVKEFSPSLKSAELVTTDEVLTEFLNFFSDYNLRMRLEAIQRFQEINREGVEFEAIAFWHLIEIFFGPGILPTRTPTFLAFFIGTNIPSKKA